MGFVLSMKVVLILANSAGPDEMQHFAAFHLSLYCLPKYQSSLQRLKFGSTAHLRL